MKINKKCKLTKNGYEQKMKTRQNVHMDILEHLPTLTDHPEIPYLANNRSL